MTERMQTKIDLADIPAAQTPEGWVVPGVSQY